MKIYKNVMKGERRRLNWCYISDGFRFSRRLVTALALAAAQSEAGRLNPRRQTFTRQTFYTKNECAWLIIPTKMISSLHVLTHFENTLSEILK